MNFEWIQLKKYNEKSIYEKGYPDTLEISKKYGFLDIIDNQFDNLKNVKSPYSLEHGESGAINSYFLSLWDFFKNIESKKEKEIAAHYVSIVDNLNYILSLSRYKKRRVYFSNKNEFENKLKELLDFYVRRGNFKYVNNDNKEVLEEIDKKFGYNKNYKVTIYIDCDGNTKELNIDSDFDPEIYVKKENGKFFFDYYIESEFDIDSFGENNGGKSIVFDLLDSARKTIESFFNSKYFNFYEEFFKVYFYKVLVEKYRTKDLEDSISQKLTVTDPGSEKVIGNIFVKLNGKGGTIGSPVTAPTTKKIINFDKLENLKIPFYRSEFLDGNMIFYVEKNNLPASFNTLKNYSNVEDYFIKTSNNFKGKFSDLKGKYIEEEQVGDEIIITEKESANNIYADSADFIDSNLPEITNNKIKSLLFSVKPCFNFTFDANETREENIEFKKEVYNVSNNVFDLSYERNPIEFGREIKDKVIRDYVKITVFNPYSKNIKCGKIDLGVGYLNVQEITHLAKDNVFTNFNSSRFELQSARIAKNNDNKFKKYSFDKDSDGSVLKQYEQDINNKNYSERRNLPKNEDFISTLEDNEITVIHLCDYNIGETTELEWAAGYLNNNNIIEKTDVPEFKKTNIYYQNGKFMLDLSNMYEFNTIETIKQIEIIDFNTGDKYQFQTEGVFKKVYLENYNTLELNNDYDFRDVYIANDKLHNYLKEKISSGALEISEKPNGNEIIISSKSANYTLINGNTIVVGKEYETKLDKFMVTKDGDDYILTIIGKNDGDLTFIEENKIIIKKSLILKPNSDVMDYLNLVYNGSRNVYLSSYVQREGKSKISNLSLIDLKVYCGDYEAETAGADIYIGLTCTEVNNEYAQITVEL